jgi:hypothetical protein
MMTHRSLNSRPPVGTAKVGSAKLGVNDEVGPGSRAPEEAARATIGTDAVGPGVAVAAEAAPVGHAADDRLETPAAGAGPRGGHVGGPGLHQEVATDAPSGLAPVPRHERTSLTARQLVRLTRHLLLRMCPRSRPTALHHRWLRWISPRVSNPQRSASRCGRSRRTPSGEGKQKPN